MLELIFAINVMGKIDILYKMTLVVYAHMITYLEMENALRAIVPKGMQLILRAGSVNKHVETGIESPKIHYMNVMMEM